MKPRWDIDERGRGVASAEEAVPDLDRLREAMLVPDWVSEDPDAHLLPHMRRVCDERGWKLERGEIVDAVLEVDALTPEGSPPPREAAFALLGSFAEASTHIVERSLDVGRDVELFITTGMLEGDGQLRAARPYRAHPRALELNGSSSLFAGSAVGVRLRPEAGFAGREAKHCSLVHQQKKGARGGNMVPPRPLGDRAKEPVERRPEAEPRPGA